MGSPPLTPLLSWVSPMKLRLRATPIAAAALTSEMPAAALAAIASTLLSMVVLSVAVTLNDPPIDTLSVPRSLSSIRA